MVEVYSDHVDLTTEFFRSNRQRRIPNCRQILSSPAIFSSGHPFRLTTTPTDASEVPLFIKANHAPLQHSTLHHALLFFLVRGSLFQHTPPTPDSPHADKPFCTTPIPCRRRKVALLPLFLSGSPSFLGFLPFLLDFFKI